MFGHYGLLQINNSCAVGGTPGGENNACKHHHPSAAWCVRVVAPWSGKVKKDQAQIASFHSEVGAPRLKIEYLLVSIYCFESNRIN
jgi:hypothetical protein